VHPDLHFVYRQLNREHPDQAVRRRKALDIGVDVLRHFLIEKVGLTPVRGRGKVFVVREADRMTVAAQNALLKTLEEPPRATVIILLVGAVDRLLPTTLSRCQVVGFDALPTGFIRDKLAELVPDLPAGRIEWYARQSEGSLGRAVQRAADGLYELNQRVIGELSQLPGRRSDRLVKTWIDESKSLGDQYRKIDPDISDTEATQRGLKTILELAALWYADILRCGTGNHTGIVNAEIGERLSELSRSIDPEQAGGAIARVVQAERQLDLHVNTLLCVETLLNDLAQVGVRRAAAAR
jgi:DNA polymerase-3 subunit delta'